MDLHRGFAELDDRDEAELFGHSREVAAGGQRARVFGPEDHLRLLALHMLRHGVLRPVWLCDVALALESRPSDFDWAWFLAGDPRRRRWAVCALGLAHQLLGASLDGVPVADEAKRIPAWLAPSVLGEWSSPRAPQGARTPMAEELRHPSRLLRAMRLRWPNAIEATVDVGGPFNEWPRLPLQLAECLLRSMRFTRRLPALVSGRE